MRSNSGTIRIVLADDHEVMRGELRLLLEDAAGLEVVAEASDVEGAVRCAREYEPDVLVLDLEMPGGSSLDAVAPLRERCPATQVVVLAMRAEPTGARESMLVGALGYVCKEAADEELVQAVRDVAAGDGYLSPLIGDAASAAALGVPRALSPRELDVLRLIALGHTNSEIAERLFLSVRTIETHRCHVQRKLSMRSRAELVGYALASGLVVV